LADAPRAHAPLTIARRDPYRYDISRAVTLIGRGGDAADSARDFLQRNGVALRWIDLDDDPLGAMLPDEELRAASLPLAIRGRSR
jgi:hypothetical protein